MHKAAIPLLTATLLLASGAIVAAKESGKPTTAVFKLDVRDPSAATLTIEQRWEGAQAIAFRQSLDAYFGNGDGTLNATEVDAITNALEKDMMTKSFPVVTFDSTLSTVSSVNVTWENVVGNISMAQPVVMKHSVSLVLSPAPGDSHTIAISPLWNGTYEVSIPTGAAVSSGSASGVMRSGQAFSVVYGPPQATQANASPTPSTPIESTPTAAPNESVQQPPQSGPSRSIPGVGFAGILMASALAVLATRMLVSRRR